MSITHSVNRIACVADNSSGHDFSEWADEARKLADEELGRRREVLTVAFFDISGSTAAKLERGNIDAVKESFVFTSLASRIVAERGGSPVKSLGDGLLVTFPDPMSACRTALEIRRVADEELDLSIKAGMTVGRPIAVEVNGTADVLGDVVDRAARIEGLANQGQILMDEPMFSQIQADLAGQDVIVFDEAPRNATAPGIGPISLREVALKGAWNLKKSLATPFYLNASGRPSLEEKLALVANAETEIVEIGIGLTSFARYFDGQKPSEFRDPLRLLGRKGVHLRCYALDQSHSAGMAWLDEQGDADYASDAARARSALIDESGHWRREHYRGKLEYLTYERVPEFWCLGVDLDDPLNGRMFYAPYLMNTGRSRNPVVQVSRLSNPELYETYLRTVDCVREASTRQRKP